MDKINLQIFPSYCLTPELTKEEDKNYFENILNILCQRLDFADWMKVFSKDHFKFYLDLVILGHPLLINNAAQYEN